MRALLIMFEAGAVAVLAVLIRLVAWQRASLDACRDAMAAALDTFWGETARGDVHRPESMWIQRQMTSLDAAIDDFRQHLSTDPGATLAEDVHPEHSDHAAVVSYAATHYMSPTPSEAERAALLRAVERKGIRELTKMMASATPPRYLTTVTPWSLGRAESLERQCDALLGLGTWCRANGVGVVRGPGDNTFVPARAVLRAIGFGFLKQNCKQKQLEETTAILDCLGLSVRSLMMRDDAYALKFYLSAHLTVKALRKHTTSGVLRRVGNTEFYRVRLEFFGIPGGGTVDVEALGGDGLQSTYDNVLPSQAIFQFARTMLTPSAFAVFQNDPSMGVELAGSWMHSASVRKAKFAKYISWIFRTAQGACATCLDDFTRDYARPVTVAESAHDHIVAGGGARAAADWANSPWGEPAVVNRLFGMRAVHHGSQCHDLTHGGLRPAGS
jgi:hypothetical protein